MRKNGEAVFEIMPWYCTATLSKISVKTLIPACCWALVLTACLIPEETVAEFIQNQTEKSVEDMQSSAKPLARLLALAENATQAAASLSTVLEEYPYCRRRTRRTTATSLCCMSMIPFPTNRAKNSCQTSRVLRQFTQCSNEVGEIGMR